MQQKNQMALDQRAQSGPSVEELLQEMTLLEKLGQMRQHPHGIGALSDAERDIREGRCGSVLNAGTLEERNRLQRIAIEETRLGVPLIFGRDVIHGLRTIFPIPLGQAASFDAELVERVAAASAREALELGIDWTFAPMVDIARDPRWGRVAESFGEDPHLASQLGRAAVFGYQGRPSSVRAQAAIAACAKHFAGYGAAEAGKDYNSTWIPEPLLRDVYLEPFRACVEAGVWSLMTAFSDLNGIPATGNEFLLRDILKGEWRFEGVVLSDWGSTQELIEHGLCAHPSEAAATALAAGLDMEMATRSFIEELPRLVENGHVSVAWVDDAVRRILALKHKLGLFERPYADVPKVSVMLCREHLELARQSARASIVLLKNERGCLPLKPGLSSLAVIGPLADDAKSQLGCWSYDGDESAVRTPLAELRARLGSQLSIRHAAGVPSCRSDDERGFEEAVLAVRSSEVALVFVGEDAGLSGECRNRAFIGLPGAQSKLITALAATGTPLVLVFMAGRPLTIGEECQRAHAVLFAWHPGTMGGPALVDLLTGASSPCARLPISFPRTVGQIPIYHSSKNSGRPPKSAFKGIPTGTPLDPVGFECGYLDVESTPEFPFGYGLSYSEFRYAELRATPARAEVGERVLVEVDVENVGQSAAEDVVQLYVRDLTGSLTRPARELKAFERLGLGPGERRRLCFELGTEELAFCRRDLTRGVEPGKFEVYVGADCRAELRTQFELVASA
jgi:beta-glucosidase